MTNPDQAPENQIFLKQPTFDLGKIDQKVLKVIFSEEEVTTDAGLLPIAAFAEATNFFAPFCGILHDDRRAAHHSTDDLLKQRVYQYIAGYPDALDSNPMRHDAALQAVLNRDNQPLASQPTISRHENSVTTRDLIRLGRALCDSFLAAYTTPPTTIVLDMDPTAHLVYGQQQLALFNTHVGDSCLMPFHVYDGITGRIVTALIRPGKTPTDREILYILRRVVSRIRQRYPLCAIYFRADSHHTKPAVMDWLETHHITYITGLSQNSVLNTKVAHHLKNAQAIYKYNVDKGQPGKEVRTFHEIQYAAGSWSLPRRVICRVLVSEMGSDIRYIVTNILHDTPKYLYETVYCGRGNCELNIKDHKNGFESDRSPCQSAHANQYRLMVASIAYNLLHHFRATTLKGTMLGRSSFQQIRAKFLKLAARVSRTAQSITFHLPVNFDFKHIFARTARLVLNATVPHQHATPAPA